MQTRVEAENKFEISRRNLLAVVAFSAINILFVLLNMNVSFLFSATAPMFVVQIGQWMAEEIAGALLPITAVIAFGMVSFYAICYFLAKKHRVFILVALILFSLDTLFLMWVMLIAFDPVNLIDVVFHVWVMYYLVIGAKAWSALKKMPAEEFLVESPDAPMAESLVASVDEPVVEPLGEPGNATDDETP